jgi:hypothetical protein
VREATSLGCNWLVPRDQELGGQRGRCLADSLIRREPDADDTIAVEKLVSTGIALRRLIYQLVDVSEHPESVRMLYPDDERLEHFGDDARVVVSEPLTHLPGMWREVPAGTALTIGADIEERAFEPINPIAA